MNGPVQLRDARSPEVSVVASPSALVRTGAMFPAGLAFLSVILLAAGCATSGSGTKPPRPGDGLREYLGLVQALHEEVSQLGRALDTMAVGSRKQSVAAYARFNGGLQRLEVDSIKIRARAEAMEKRGAAYFEEWAEELAGPADRTSRQAARQRFEDLHAHFDAILEDSRRVRQSFRAFLEASRQLHAKLGSSPSFDSISAATKELSRAVEDFRQSDMALGQLSKTLKAAEAAVRAGPLPSLKP